MGVNPKGIRSMRYLGACVLGALCVEVSELFRILSPVCQAFEIFGYLLQHVRSEQKQSAQAHIHVEG